MGLGRVNGLPTWIGPSGDADQVQGIQVSATYLPTLGVLPRAWASTSAGAGGSTRWRPRWCLTQRQSHWKKHFNSDPGVRSGQTLTLDGLPHTIVGVLPAALSSFPLNQTDL